MTRREELENRIIYHKQKYYRGEPEISDAEYDALEDDLRDIAPDSYVLSLIGYEVSEQKIRHASPMLSLDKRRNVSDIVQWMDAEPCLVTHKMDGSSASLEYAKGVFHLAKTRGDGTFGENLTAYFRHIRIPKILFSSQWRGRDLEIRGELCIHRESFDRLAEEMVSRKLERPRSIRNIVAGLLHKKEDLDLCAWLDFFAYEVIGDLSITSEEEKFALLEQEGFRTPHRVWVSGESDFQRVVDAYVVTADEGGWLTDGLVLSVNSLDKQRLRGSTAHHPRGKIAFKFKSDTAETVVREIFVDVGRTGRLTFVGKVDPVALSGATVSRVTLNNVRYIRDHGINCGCTIEITRSGEVIPKHEQTLKTCGTYVFPMHCPACATDLQTSDSGVDLICPNMVCSARIRGRLANWIAVTGIDSVGDATLLKLQESGRVNCIADLYRLKTEDLRTLEGLGERSAQKRIDSIQSTLRMPFDTFLTALGIDGLGPSVARMISSVFADPSALKAASKSDLMAISGIGETLAVNVLDGMNSVGWKTLSDLSSLGFQLATPLATPSVTNRILTGKTVVITGKLSRPREEIVAVITLHGGKVTGSVSAATDFLLCNDPSASGKYRKAEQLGISIVTEAELAKMIET